MTVREIVDKEWVLFTKVKNYGGRASCQENPTTFYIMRSSQLAAWNDAMRESYFNDLVSAEQKGRNLLSEKYGYMMKRTSPVEYVPIREALPIHSIEKERLVAQICNIHVEWMEALVVHYPRLTNRGRSIYKESDRRETTSFETYLWGELMSYSEETLHRYLDYVVRLQKEERNMNEMILENTVHAYGFDTLEQAERRIAGRFSCTNA